MVKCPTSIWKVIGVNPVENANPLLLSPLPPPAFFQDNISSLSFIHQAANFVNSALSGNAIANNSLTDNINLLFLFRGCIETGQWRMCYMSGRLVYRYEAIPGPD